MKVTVRNLGIIKDEATIDLKPLTIFIGPNNSGKTWFAYAIAGVLGSYGTSEYIQAYINEQVPQLYKPLNDAVEKVLTEGSATIDLYRFMEEYGEVYFNEIARYSQNWMSDFLSTEYVRFSDLDISLELVESKSYLLQRILRYQRRINVAKGLLTIQKTRDDSKVYAFTVTEGQNVEEQEEEINAKIPLEEVRRRLVNFVFTAIRQSLYTKVDVFPTERTTLVASRFSERITDEEQLQKRAQFTEALNTLAKELGINELPTSHATFSTVIPPLGTFLSMLSSLFGIGTKQKEARQKQGESDPKILQYIELADILEKQILGGNVQFSTPEPHPNRQILFQPSQDTNLEIPIASSMVKELAPLVLYLRYLAQLGDLVIIDEPEMNLHPKAQVQIIEFLAMLVNAGLHVLITTHSPYVIDHSGNLIRAYQIESQEHSVDPEMFLLSTKYAFIAQDKVSAYSFEDGKVESILREDGTINWQTFSEVTQYIQRVNFEL